MWSSALRLHRVLVKACFARFSVREKLFSHILIIDNNNEVDLAQVQWKASLYGVKLEGEKLGKREELTGTRKAEEKGAFSWAFRFPVPTHPVVSFLATSYEGKKSHLLFIYLHFHNLKTQCNTRLNISCSCFILLY